MKRLLALALVLASSGCLGTVEPLPFDVKLEAAKTTLAAGEVMDFVVTTQGKTLLTTAIDFGDGATDEFALSGARKARMTFPHAFDVAGTYLVKATVIEATEGEKSATVQVTVN